MQNNHNNNFNNSGRPVKKIRSDLLVFAVLSVIIAALLVCFAAFYVKTPADREITQTSASAASEASSTAAPSTDGSGTGSTVPFATETQSTASTQTQSATTEEETTATTSVPTTTKAAAATTKTVTTATKAVTTATKTATTTTKAGSAISSKLNGFSVKCDYFIGFDKTNNTVLYEKNADARCYPASVTKMLTALVAIENMPLRAEVTVGDEIKMIAGDSSIAGLRAGQVFTLKDILYGLMLPSGNDAAYTIAVNVARYIYGKDISNEEAVSRFMTLCNSKLKKIGAKNTHFSCPDGYHHDDHYTTVRDVLKIAVFAMENTTFAEIVGTKSIKVTTKGGSTIKWTNSNRLIDPDSSEYYKYCTGIKTGLTDEAKYCLAASAVKEVNGTKHELFAIAFHASDAYSRNADVRAYFAAAFAQ